MNIILFILIIIVLIEYIGIGQYVPAVNRLSISLVLAFSAFAYLIMKNGVRDLIQHKQTKIFIILFLWTCVSLFYAYLSMSVINSLKVQVGYFMLFGICYYVFRNIRCIKIFITVFIIIHAVLIILNIELLTAAGRNEVFRAGYFLGDGNDFSWSLAIVLPFALHLVTKSSNKLLNLVSLGATVLIVAGIIIVQSRGAAIAVAASITFLIITSKRRMLALAVASCCMVLVAAFAPIEYFQRLQSITSYEQDSSSVGRLTAWKAAIMIAVDNPLGVGPGNFQSAYGREYRDQISDRNMWRPDRWISVHSIYFLTLAEFGFLGLVLLLLLLYWNIRSNLRIRYLIKTESKDDQFVLAMGRTVNASIISFAVGGIFLGGLNYPHIYILSALTTGLAATERQSSRIAETKGKKKFTAITTHMGSKLGR